jgi:hypothetical protein
VVTPPVFTLIAEQGYQLLGIPLAGDNSVVRPPPLWAINLKTTLSLK